MLYGDCDSNSYTKLMNTIKTLNKDYIQVRRSSAYSTGTGVTQIIDHLRHFRVKELIRLYLKWSNLLSSGRFDRNVKNNGLTFAPNYFSYERIAVYTVIFGKYDKLLEPYVTPDNIDYWIITDQEIDLTNSAWKKKDINEFTKTIEKFTNIEKNRFFKMNVNTIFPDYKFTCYIDGNIQIISDITEYIYHIGNSGVAMHMHSSRDCVYDEMPAILHAKKASREQLDIHKKHLQKELFPTHYGMLECNVIVRENTSLCKRLMDNWWQEFTNYSKRDQLSFPFVLYKNNIQVSDVGTLGNNVYENPSFRVVTHS